MRQLTGTRRTYSGTMLQRGLRHACAMLLSACLMSGQAGRASAADEPPIMLLQTIAGAPPAPDFELPDLDDAKTRFSSLRGKVVIVNFWATWCPPCRKEIPSMERAWNKIKDKGVVLLAVHVGGSGDKIWDFTSRYNVTFPVLIDKSGKVSKEWRTIGLPTTYVVGPKGRKVLRAVGGREWDNDKLLERILALRDEK